MTLHIGFLKCARVVFNLDISLSYHMTKKNSLIKSLKGDKQFGKENAKISYTVLQIM